MEPIIESLQNLRVINHFIRKYLDASIEVSSNQIIIHALKSQILILANSYLDEYDGFLKPTSTNLKAKEDLLCAKSRAKPAIKRIKKWKDLKTIRNAVLAHNLRDRQDGFRSVFLSDKYDTLNIPNDISEFFLLSDLINIATIIVCEPFTTEIELRKEIYFQPKGETVFKRIDLPHEVRMVMKEIEKIKCNDDD